MEKKIKKITCPRCKGNGYIKIPHESVEKLRESVIAHKESLILISKMGFKYINDNKIAIKYSCQEVSSI